MVMDPLSLEKNDERKQTVDVLPPHPIVTSDDKILRGKAVECGEREWKRRGIEYYREIHKHTARVLSKCSCGSRELHR